MDAKKMTRPHSTSGGVGSIFVNNTTPVDGTFYAVQVVAANTKVTLDGNVDEAAALGLVALPTGFTIYGRFNTVTVSVGSAILHRI